MSPLISSGGVHYGPGQDGSDADTQWHGRLYAGLNKGIWTHRDGTTVDLSQLSGQALQRAIDACRVLHEIDATGGS